MNEIDLTKKLVEIPSFVDENNNENEIGKYICEYIKRNIPKLKIFKQKIGNDRFNVIAYNSSSPKIIFSSHMDTVKGINFNNKVNIEGDKLNGLGALDMKGGLACSIIAAQRFLENDNIPLALILTCDEEYYFLGVNKFIEEYTNSLLPIKPNKNPILTIFPEPSSMNISYGCRGCVELDIQVIGKTAHAGRVNLGVNAIEKSVELVNILKKELIKDCEYALGLTTVNLASISGGININGEIVSQPNAIPNISRFTLDIRTSSLKQNAKYIIKIINNIAKELNISIEYIKTKLDMYPYIANKKKLKLLEESISKNNLRVKYIDDISNSGIGEFSLVGSILNWNAINYGPGPSCKAHQIDEYVNINDLKKITNIYYELLKLI